VTSLNYGIPVIVLEGSNLSNALTVSDTEPDNLETLKKMSQSQKDAIEKLSKSKFYRCPDSSEDLASIVHLLLTISF
jgi:hypothetical protein